jgi:hypothetical protein
MQIFLTGPPLVKVVRKMGCSPVTVLQYALAICLCTEAEFLDEILKKVIRVFLLAIHHHLRSLLLRASTNGIYPPPPPPRKSGLKLVCNVITINVPLFKKLRDNLTRIPSGESIWGSRSKKDRLLNNQ